MTQVLSHARINTRALVRRVRGFGVVFSLPKFFRTRLALSPQLRRRISFVSLHLRVRPAFVLAVKYEVGGHMQKSVHSEMTT